MCDSGVGEGVAHFLLSCGLFERDRLVLLDDVYRIVKAIERLDKFWRVDEKGKWRCCLEKGWRAYVTE